MEEPDSGFHAVGVLTRSPAWEYGWKFHYLTENTSGAEKSEVKEKIPVSYTHLDVYQRQDRRRTPVNENLFRTQFDQLETTEKQALMEDVYKRQAGEWRNRHRSGAGNAGRGGLRHQ